MAKILCTISALILHTMGIYIFQESLILGIEDDLMDCEEPIRKREPITNFLLASGVYVIIVQISIFPSTFQKPPASLLCLYEFFATFFLLEICLACIWNPLSILILSTIPKNICHWLLNFELEQAGEWIDKYQAPMKALSFSFSLGFLLITLYITKAVDFSVISDYGVMVFADLIVWNFYKRLSRELPNNFVTLFGPVRKKINRCQHTAERCKICKCCRD